MIESIEEIAKKMNQITYWQLYDHLSLLAKNMFKWEGLPDSVDEEYLEKVLYEDGKIIFLNDPTYGYMVARGNMSHNINIYEKPTHVRTNVHSNLFKNRDISTEECVIIRNNANETPTKKAVLLYSIRISDAQRTADVNIKQQKTPLIMLCDDKQKLTLENIYAKTDGNEPVIFGNKSMREVLNGIKVIETKAPFIADKLLKYKHDMTNEFFTFIGVNNVNTDKRERLVTDEVNANNEQIEFSAEIMLESRKRACKLINDMFKNINCSVSLREVNINKNNKNKEDDNDE